MEADSRLRCPLGNIRYRISVMAATVLGIACCLSGVDADAADYRTQNFLIQAPSPALARQVGEAAEKYRNDLAIYWLGSPLPAWPMPCPVQVVAGDLAAQGVTNYFTNPVRDFQMEVVGTPERILDSVLPHEVTHTVLATHFGRPLPRWADEGICTTVEHASERSKHEAKLREFLSTRRGIAMNQLFLLTEYPNDVLPMYAQGYSVCRFLIEQKDARTFIAFLTDYMRSPSWTANIKKHYGYDSLAELQQYWLAWVSDGSGSVDPFAKIAPSRIRNATAGGTDIALSAPDAVVRPAAAMAPATSQIASATALASVSADGWYQRKRQEAAGGDASLAAAPTATTPMVPPSVRTAQGYSGQGYSGQVYSNQGYSNQAAAPSTSRQPASDPHNQRYRSAQPQPETRFSRAPDGNPSSHSTMQPPINYSSSHGSQSRRGTSQYR